MKKRQIIQTIIEAAKDTLESKIAINDEEREVAKKIIAQGDACFSSLTAEEVEDVITLLSHHYSFGEEEIEDCIDFLTQ